jgi:energy-converting hydrogenase Eha subunit E
LALASQQLAQELPELQQLHERLAVFALVALVALVAPEQREPVLKQLVQQVPLVLVQLVPQNFSPNQY